jgi:tRNA uridine 5-carbamoylmethylation protein Kti12
MAFYVIIRGPLGCGKSTIARSISKELNSEYLEVDRVLDENDLTKEWEKGYISQKSFIKANEIIASKAKSALERGTSMVFDGNFYWKPQIDNLIEKLDFPHYVFTLKAPLEICIERDSKRDKPYGEDATKAVYKKSIEFDYGKVININKPLDKCVKEILSYLPKK